MPRFSATLLGQAGSLDCAQALLLALGRDTERRRILSAWLEEGSDDANLPILELAAASEERREAWRELVGLGHKVEREQNPYHLGG